MDDTSPKLADTTSIAERVATFDRWHYAFDLDGVTTPIADPSRVNRHEQRRNYHFEALLSLSGGTLEGKRVLDLGCNAGFWSLEAIRHGAEFVVGIDGRQMHIDQANLVFEVKGVDESRYEFVEGNIFDFDVASRGPFDIVLCLGLLYHVSKPVELFELMAASEADVILVDTAITRDPRPILKVKHEAMEDPRNAFDYEVVTVPSRRALRLLASQFGYTLTMLRPSFSSWEGALGYRYRRRRAFVCSREGLGAHPLDVEEFGSQTAALDVVAAFADSARRAAGRLRRRLRHS